METQAVEPLADLAHVQGVHDEHGRRRLVAQFLGGDDALPGARDVATLLAFVQVHHGRDTLDADDSHVGLIQFKVGTGGHAVEYAGEWDLPLNRALYKAFDLYMARR